MTIQRYLEEIADLDTPLKAGPLTRLTRLDEQEKAELAAMWPSLPLERRREIVEQIATLAEDNVELDFDAVFFQALLDSDQKVRVAAIRGLWEYTERDLIPILMEMTRDDVSPAVRAEAALALGRFVMLGEFEEARPRDVEAITDALRALVADRSESVEVRARAVESLGASSQPWARDIIHDAYDSNDDRMMSAAIHAMGRSADSYWLATVLDELRSPSVEMRYEAASAAGMIEDEEAVPFLVEMLDEEEDPEVLEQALSALGDIGGEDAIAALRARMNDEDQDERVREAARLALDEAEFGDDPMGFRE